MQPWAPKCLQMFSKDMSDRNWIFIIGCYNSGTTLLAELLQTHPELTGLRNEGAFLTDQLPYPERLGWPRLWFKCAEDLRVAENEVDRAELIKRHWSIWVRDDSKYVVEKSISNTLRVRFLEANFKNAKFVHVIRNGFAVAAGIRRKANLRRWKNPEGLVRYPIGHCAQQWNESLEVVEKEIERGAPVVNVSYEDIVADPVNALRPVFKFLGVEPIANASAWGKMHVHEKSSKIRNMNDASMANLSPDEINIIRDIAGPNLSKYHYQ